MECVRVSTLPLGEHPGVERECPRDMFDQLTTEIGKDAFSAMVPSVETRTNMFVGGNYFRRHTLSQVSMSQDQMLSKVTLDGVFVFSIRPPELPFVDGLE